MAFLIDQLNNSGLFAQSSYSAGIATCDSDGNVITATYLTGVDLTPYQTTAGMTGYATTGDVANKLDTTAFSDVSGTFLTAHQSLDGYATTAWVDSQGYLTAHQPISADEWNDVYNTVNSNSGSWSGEETVLSGDVISGKFVNSVGNITTHSAISSINSSGFGVLPLGTVLQDGIGGGLMQFGTTSNRPAFVTGGNRPSDNAWSTGNILILSGSQGQGYYKGHQLFLSTNNKAAITFDANSTTIGNNAPVKIYSYSASDKYVGFTPSSIKMNNGSNSGEFTVDDFINWNDTCNTYQTNSATYLTAHQDLSADEWNDVYNTVNSNSGLWSAGDTEVNTTVQNNSATWNNVSNKLDTTSFSDVSGTFLTAHQSISADEWNDVYETVGTNSGSWGGGSTYTGDAQGALDEVYTNSGDWNDVYSTVYNNSGSWTGGGGGSIDTIPFIVQSPLTTGISGYSAYIGLDGEAFESSAYVPYSAITDNYTTDGYVHNINGSGIFADEASHSNNTDYANYDYNGNSLTDTTYYATEAYNTVQSNSADWGGGSTPVSGLELSAGNYITIIDDIQNSASIISVTGLATAGDLNYVSGVVGNVESLLAQL